MAIISKNTNSKLLTTLVTLTLTTAIPVLLTGCASYSTETKGNTTETSITQTRNTAQAEGSPTLQQSVLYRFATMKEAENILSTDDEYTIELQMAEIGIKNQNASKTSLTDLKNNYRNSVLPWADNERAALIKIVEELGHALKPYEKHLPSQVLMGKISSGIEGGLPHTRANMILFSEGPLDAFTNTVDTNPEKAYRDLKSLFLHELHHVMSRNNRDRHDDYYALIGFEPCTFTAPQSLRSRRLSNPDAPSYKHFAPVTIEQGNGVIPYLTITKPYDEETKGTLGNYFNFGLLAVNAQNGACTIAGETPQLLSPAIVPDFFKLIGQNTGYIIHPEETLADNFTYLILGRADLPNPEIPEKIKTFWLGE